jgi:hypothetical protein
MILILANTTNPTATALRDHIEQALAREVLCLDGTHLIDALRCDDSIEASGAVKIRWIIDGLCIDCDQVEGVVNLLDLPPDSIAARFIEEDRAYAFAEYSAYLYFALTTFRNVLNLPRGGSLFGLDATLPLQWAKIRAVDLMAVPDAFYGLASQVPISLRLSPNTVVSCNPFDYGQWVSHGSTRIPPTGWALFYRRPPGSVIVCSAIDDYVVARIVSQSVTVHDVHFAVACTQKVMQVFGLRLAHVLLFRSQDTWTFGAITPRFSIQEVPASARNEFLTRVGNALGGIQ